MPGRRTKTLGGIAIALGVLELFVSLGLLVVLKELARLQGVTIRAAAVREKYDPIWYFSSIAFLLISGFIATVSGLGLFRGHEWSRKTLRWLVAILLVYYGCSTVSSLFLLLYQRHHGKPLWFYIVSYFCSLAWGVGLFTFWRILGDVEVRTDVREPVQSTA